MRRRSLAHGTVSAVGFGCMSFGGFYGPTTEARRCVRCRRARSRRRFLGHRQCLWRGRERDADRQVPGRGPGPPGPGHAGDQIRDPPPRRRTRVFDNSPAISGKAWKGRSNGSASITSISTTCIASTEHPDRGTVGELARHVEAGTIGAVGLSEVPPTR